jgi:hypothetical protein
MAKVLDSAGAAIDKLGGHVTMPYTSVVITSARPQVARAAGGAEQPIRPR